MEFETKATGQRKPNKTTLAFSTEMTESAPRVSDGPMLSSEYVMTATARISFYANSAQYRDKEKIAKEALLAFMYQDALQIVSELRLMAESDDMRSHLDELHRVMTKGHFSNKKARPE